MSEENGNGNGIKPRSSHRKDVDGPERPVLSLRSNDEEIFREVCLNNGINFKKINEEGPQLLVLEMFFSGFPRLIGLHLFPNLSTLTVIGQSISRLEGISALPNLQQLWIAECQITKIEGLERNYNLMHLYIYGNKISVIENIQHLSNLSVLWLNNNLIRNIENLSSLSNLRELNLAENKIGKIGNALTANAHLEDLNLSGNPLWSLRDLTCLARLNKLNRLSLKDPLYQACPVSQLCNYSTHMMYHLPKVVYLDTLDVSSKQMIALAESTVSKKKMFYNMRAKTIRRNMSQLLSSVSDLKRELVQKPINKLRLLNFVIKEMEREKASQPDGEDDFCDSDPESERDVKIYKPKPEKSPFQHKLETLIMKRKRWEDKSNEIESFAKAGEKRIRQLADMMVNRLVLELETGGNVRFEVGQATDPWFTSCHDLVLSRFCAYDYRDLGVVGIKIHRIVRVHNRMLRTRFDRSIVQLTESNKGEYYPGVKNTAYKKSLEYLFWVCDPDMPGGINESHRIPEEGFLDAETYAV